jgi:regulator of sigma E protease
MDMILWLLPAVPVFLLVISVVITIHELGHYWVGRLFGAAAESFAVGFGRPIFEVKDKRGTRWRINWIPLGGFVKFVGEAQLPQDTEEAAQLAAKMPPKADPAGDYIEHDGRIITGKPYTALGPWPRIAVSLGGPLANFIFAIGAFAVFGYANGLPQSKEIFVEAVTVDGAAHKAGFLPGDIILQAGGRKVQTTTDVTQATQLSSGEPVSYLIRRDSEEMTLVATPVEREVVDKDLRMKQKIGRIDLQLNARDSEWRSLNPIEAVGHGVQRTADSISQTLNVLRRLITGKEGIDKLSGPVGILHLTSGVTQMTLAQPEVEMGEKVAQLFWMLLQLAAMLSVGIGFFNLLPMPVLDGGAVVMTLAEAVTGKPLPERIQNAGLTIGLVCLVGFALLITLQDFFRFDGGS